MKIQRMTTTILLSTSLVHVLCCGLPVLLSFSSLAAWAGVSTLHNTHLSALHRYETEIIIGSTVLLLLTAVTQLISRKLNCVKQHACHHPPCEKEKSYAQHIFLLATLLWGVNLVHFCIG
jgi:hypothetical protein